MHRSFDEYRDGLQQSGQRCLPPLEDYTFLGTPGTYPSEKLIVEREGVIGVRKAVWIPLAEKRQKQLTVWFDPADFFPWVAESVRQNRLAWTLGDGFLPMVRYEFRHPASRQVLNMEALMAPAGPGVTDLFVALQLNGQAPVYRQGRRQLLIPEKEYQLKRSELVLAWNQFLAGGRVPDEPDAIWVRAVKASVVRAMLTYTGHHPHYGLNYYGRATHDGFPPTTIAWVDCLRRWGWRQEAAAYLSYYLDHFVTDSGKINYYGPSLAEYGQLLDLAVGLARPDPRIWKLVEPRLERLLAYLRSELEGSDFGMVRAAPEADEHDQPDYYFHNDAWCWRGLAAVAAYRQDAPLARMAERYRACILDEIAKATVSRDGSAFIPPVARRFIAPFRQMNESRLAAYTNYRYWLELMSSGILSPGQMRQIIAYRRAHGGELRGMSCFAVQGLKDVADPEWIDNWPLFEYGQALWMLGEQDAVRSLIDTLLWEAHTVQTWTTYEAFSIQADPVRYAICDYCVPAQLVVPRLAALAWGAEVDAGAAGRISSRAGTARNGSGNCNTEAI